MIVALAEQDRRFRTRLPKPHIRFFLVRERLQSNFSRKFLSPQGQWGSASWTVRSANVQLGRERCPQTSNLLRPESLWLPVMRRRIRHCVECPRCQTRYLIGSSPYHNGSYLVSCLTTDSEVHILYCSCDRSPISSRWSELKKYVVSSRAHDRGYGPPEEIVPVGNRQQGDKR